MDGVVFNMTKFPTTTVEINGEKLVTRGAKYFIYKGKRFLVKDHLINLKNKGAHNKGTDKTSEVNDVEKQSEVDNDIKDIKQSEVEEGSSHIEKVSNTTISKIGFNNKTGEIVINPSDTEEIIVANSVEDTKDIKDAKDTKDAEDIKEIEGIKDSDIGIKTKETLEIVIPVVMLLAGFLMKGDKEKKESVNGGDNW